MFEIIALTTGMHFACYLLLGLFVSCDSAEWTSGELIKFQRCVTIFLKGLDPSSVLLDGACYSYKWELRTVSFPYYSVKGVIVVEIGGKLLKM